MYGVYRCISGMDKLWQAGSCGARVYWYTSSLNHIIWFPVLYIITILYTYTFPRILCTRNFFFFTRKNFCTQYPHRLLSWSTRNSPLNNAIISIRYTIPGCTCTIRIGPSVEWVELISPTTRNLTEFTIFNRNGFVAFISEWVVNCY